MPLMLRTCGNTFNVGGRVAIPLMLEDVWQYL